PTVREITGASGFGPSIPEYPVARLAKALDELRKERRKEKILVLASGAAAWVAEKYALEYPRSTAGLVLVDGWLDSPAYAAAILRLATQGDPGERWAARMLMGEGSHDQDEAHRLRRIF